MKYPRYNIDEYVGGHMVYTTPCPFGVYGQYTHDIIRVGSLACQRCRHYKGINQQDCIVFCGIK
jgi:hypothetical protein